jgi:hypothetical protein
MPENKLVTLTLPLNSLCEVLTAVLNHCYEYYGAEDVDDIIFPAIVNVSTYVNEQTVIPDEYSSLNDEINHFMKNYYKQQQ